MECVLCASPEVTPIASDGARRYMQCCGCGLVFVPREECPGPEEQRARYELHDNALDNDEYMSYLGEVAGELSRIPLEHPSVLDFGSGPQQALAHVLEEKGIACASYDPLYSIGADALDRMYDVVVACESVEHLHDLAGDIRRIKRLLNPGGHVLVRTELYNEHTDFETWWYAKDPTHINFFRLTTILRLAERLDKGLFYTDARSIAILG
ncbi:MAG: methyltransferase domain-containing protein [Chitinivibrionales bacterium]|nr:methyltransferase domain-containing protein [Chitinivibrionales bacterium]MBD3397384.1 methyltransferase domain-containing protein [Chitinivibrionales bacterium]